MYKHLNNILEKNHIRNSRRKESLAKRTKTEMFGTKYELKKSEKQKQLHEMTRKEYETQYGKPKKSTTVTGGFHPHKEAVETAINRGIEVPDHVLADYPEFKTMKKSEEETKKKYTTPEKSNPYGKNFEVGNTVKISGAPGVHDIVGASKHHVHVKLNNPDAPAHGKIFKFGHDGYKVGSKVTRISHHQKEEVKKSERAPSLQKGESKLSVIGTTSSKKNVYDSFNHPEHKNFTAKDHEEAAKIHRGRINTKMSSRKADSIRHQEYMHANWAKTLREQ